MKDALGHGSESRGGANVNNLHPELGNPNHSYPAHTKGVQAVGQPEPPTPTIFKKHSDGGVFAAFPTLLGDMSPGTMSSYEHVGQHSSASMGYVGSAKPAKPAEYAALLTELKSIGYNPQIISRMTRAHYEGRKADLARPYAKGS